MKKTVSMILVLCLILSMTTGSYALDMTDTKSKITDALSKIENVVENIVDKLSDISNHWAKEFITSLTQKGIIGGYPDDTFRPDNKIKVTEFTVLVLKAKDIEIPTTEKWYEGAVDKAESEDIVKNGEFDSLDTRQINRGEMARMIVRALDENASSGDTWFKDDKSIPSSIKGYVKKASELGIIGGYPDGSFKHDGYATRAEASTMISKMIQVMNGETLPVEKPEVPEVPEISLNPKLFDSQYISTEFFEIKDGKVYFDGKLLESNAHPNINEQALKIADILVDKGEYLTFSDDSSYTLLRLQEAEYKTEIMSFLFYKETRYPNEKGWKPYKATINLGRMFKDSDPEDVWINEEYKEKLEQVLKVIIPDDYKEVFEYIVTTHIDSSINEEKYRGTLENKKIGSTTITMNYFFLGGSPEYYLNY